MLLQWIIVLLFALNLLSIWLTVIINKCAWYRPIGLIIMSVMPLLTVFFGQPRFDLDYFWWRIVGVAAILLGVAIAGWAKLTLWKLSDKLVTSGPYQYVRHPLYLGLVFFIVGWWWLWAAVYSFYIGMFILMLIWINAYWEEKMVMEKRFGDEYKQYKKHTGMFWIK